MMKANSGLVSKRNLLAATAVVLLSGVRFNRAAVNGRKRTVQTGKIESSPEKDGFAVQVLERSDPTSKVPTSVMRAWTYAKPGATDGKKGAPPIHIHRYDDEEFSVIEGKLGFHLDGKEGILNVGETINLPAGLPHTIWNAEPSSTVVQRLRLINRSGRHTLNERFNEQWTSNAYDYGGIAHVNPVQLLVMLDYFDIEIAFPYPVRLLVRFVVIPLGKAFGFRGMYDEYLLP